MFHYRFISLLIRANNEKPLSGNFLLKLFSQMEAYFSMLPCRLCKRPAQPRRSYWRLEEWWTERPISEKWNYSQGYSSCKILSFGIALLMFSSADAPSDSVLPSWIQVTGLHSFPYVNLSWDRIDKYSAMNVRISLSPAKFRTLFWILSNNAFRRICCPFALDVGVYKKIVTHRQATVNFCNFL